MCTPIPRTRLDWAVLERDDELDHETYWVTQEFRGELKTKLKPVRVFTCINKRGTVFLWTAKLPSPDSAIGRRWAESALEIAEYAKTCWVKMAGKKDLGAYGMFKARGNLGEPDWPDKSLSELLRLAFKGDRLIDSLNSSCAA